MDAALVISSVLLWVVVLVNLLLTLALVRRVNAELLPKETGAGGLPVGVAAPAFSAQAISGETVSLNSFSGRKVALLFISSHCQPCREFVPRVLALAQAAEQINMDLVFVSGDDLASTKSIADELHITEQVLIAPRPSNSLLSDYNVLGTPSFCLVDIDGTVRLSGALDWERGFWKTLEDSAHASNVPVPSEVVR